MDTFTQSYSRSSDNFEFNLLQTPTLSHQIHGSGATNPAYLHLQLDLNGSEQEKSPCSCSCGCSDGDTSVEHDYFEAVPSYIMEMLMEEDDLENKSSMFHDISALQAAEKSFYDVLGLKYPPPAGDSNSSVYPEDNSSPEGEYEMQILGRSSPEDGGSYYLSSSPKGPFQLHVSSSATQFVSKPKSVDREVIGFLPIENIEKSGTNYSLTGYSRGKKNQYQEESDYSQEGRRYKNLASCAEEESLETKIMCDELLLCPGAKHMGVHDELACCPFDKPLQNGGKPRRKKRDSLSEVVDLKTLLTQCAQAVSTNNRIEVEKTLKKIRQHSSPYGDSTERLAHYFANALEARFAGTGTELYTTSPSKKIVAAEVIKAYQLYVSSCPFKKMSNIFANKMVGKLARGSTRLHIIDFGILYGFQWPCLIQGLSARPGGPPRLRITGIDFPQPGFRPSERVEETGRRLAIYCKRFNVPFEYHTIAKNWDSIKLEDLYIDREEVLVVNSLYRLRNVPEETIGSLNSPRDGVLKLIKAINPDMFIHGVVNGSYNAPFFLTRFREAFFNFSVLFDMMEATVPREDQERLLFEKEIFGREVINVIACEGNGRIERPETYKQWQARNVRAGFTQIPVNKEIMKEVRAKVKLGFHKDFMVDEDSDWMLQGWKGRTVYALSCWKPTQD